MMKINIDLAQNKVVIGNSSICGFLEGGLKFKYILDPSESKWEFCERLSKFILSYYCLYGIKSDYNAILFVVNELLENAVKYSISPFLPLDIEMHHIDDTSFLRVTNEVDDSTFRRFMKTSVALFNTDLVGAFRYRLEEMTQGDTASGIGLILLRKDYNVDLCFEFSSTTDQYFISVCAAF
jgi:hypothetical protein